MRHELRSDGADVGRFRRVRRLDGARLFAVRLGREQIEPRLDHRVTLPVGALLCVVDGATAGRSWSPSAVRTTLKRLAVAAGVRRRIAPHQLRHAHAVEMAREGVPLSVIQRQLGHANLGITSIYLQGIDTSEIITTVYARPAPMLPASAGLR
jgi:integrase